MSTKNNTNAVEQVKPAEQAAPVAPAPATVEQAAPAPAVRVRYASMSAYHAAKPGSDLLGRPKIESARSEVDGAKIAFTIANAPTAYNRRDVLKAVEQEETIAVSFNLPIGSALDYTDRKTYTGPELVGCIDAFYPDVAE